MLVTPAATAQLLTLRFNRLMGLAILIGLVAPIVGPVPLATGSTRPAAPRSCWSRRRRSSWPCCWGRGPGCSDREPPPPPPPRRSAGSAAALALPIHGGVKLGGRRHPLAGAGLRRGEAGREHGATNRRRRASALDETGGKRAVERIARAGRVDRPRLARRGIATVVECLAGALDDAGRRPRPSVTTTPGAGPRPRRWSRAATAPGVPADSPADGRPADSRGLRRPRAMASSERFGVRMSARPKMPRSSAGGRGRVEDRTRARATGGVEGRAGRGRRDLVADEDDVVGRRAPGAPAQPRRRRRDGRVGAGGDGDHVLAAGVDQDQRQRRSARRRPGAAPRCRRLRPPSAAAAASPNASRPDGADELDRGAEPARRDRLVRALAAVMLLERAAADRLAGRRADARRARRGRR